MFVSNVYVALQNRVQPHSRGTWLEISHTKEGQWPLWWSCMMQDPGANPPLSTSELHEKYGEQFTCVTAQGPFPPEQAPSFQKKTWMKKAALAESAAYASGGEALDSSLVREPLCTQPDRARKATCLCLTRHTEPPALDSYPFPWKAMLATFGRGSHAHACWSFSCVLVAFRRGSPFQTCWFLSGVVAMFRHAGHFQAWEFPFDTANYEWQCETCSCHLASYIIIFHHHHHSASSSSSSSSYIIIIIILHHHIILSPDFPEAPSYITILHHRHHTSSSYIIIILHHHHHHHHRHPLSSHTLVTCLP
eukprot:1160498-Pelagomonas_calceolata.AAC.9